MPKGPGFEFWVGLQTLAMPLDQRMRLAVRKVKAVTSVAAKRALMRLRGIDPDAPVRRGTLDAEADSYT